MARLANSGKYETILEAAGSLFFKHGYAATSIEAIAIRAGASKVTISNRFGTKERLFGEAIRRESAQLQVELSWDKRTGSLRDELINFGQSLNAFLDRPELVQFQRRFGADLDEHPEVGKAILDAGPHHVHSHLTAILTAAESNGHISTSRIDCAAEQLISLCRGLGDIERLYGQAPSRDETSKRVEAAVDLFLSVYACKDSGSDWKARDWAEEDRG